MKTQITKAARIFVLGLAVATPMLVSAPASAAGGRNAAVGLGILGVLGAGAIIANSQPRYYGNGYSNGYSNGYAQPAYVDPDCEYVRQQVWNGYRYVWRNVQVCD